MRQREDWIDLSRSIVMIMVIFGHIGSFLTGKGYQSSNLSVYFMATSAIKIPGFFVISGYLFNDRQGRWNDFVKNKIIKILVPYFFLGFISMAMNVLIYMYHVGAWNEQVKLYFINYFKNYLLGKNLWFIPCLFVVEVIFFVIKKISKNNLLLMGFLSIACCCAGYFWSKPEIAVPWRIDTALICIFFLYLGFMLQSYPIFKGFILSFKGFIFSLIIYTGMGILSYTMYGWKNLDVNRNYYYNFILCMFMIIAGTMLLFSFCKLVNSNRILSFIGQNTLAYFAFHLFFVKIIYKFIVNWKFFDNCTSFMIKTFILCFITLICMAPFIGFINKYIPIIVGKNSRRKK